MLKLLSVTIACALRWGVASVGFTLLGVAHPILDHFRCGTSAGGWLSSEPARVKKARLWLINYFYNCFVTFIFVTNECWHVILC